MAQPATVQLLPTPEGKWTTNVQGETVPAMAEALRALADKIERSAASSRGLEALRALHAAQEGQGDFDSEAIDDEIRAARVQRRALP